MQLQNNSALSVEVNPEVCSCTLNFDFDFVLTYKLGKKNFIFRNKKKLVVST